MHYDSLVISHCHILIYNHYLKHHATLNKTTILIQMHFHNVLKTLFQQQKHILHRPTNYSQPSCRGRVVKAMD